MWVGSDWDGFYQWTGEAFKNYRSADGLCRESRACDVARSSGRTVDQRSRGRRKPICSGKIYQLWDRCRPGWNRVYAIHEDEDGALWFSTRAGLTRLKDGKFFSYTSTSGLPVDFVYSILDDGLGNFWFSSAQGLFKVSKAELANIAGRAR